MRPRMVAFVAVPWVLGMGVLLVWGGPVEAVNPFVWMLSLKEFFEFLVWVPGNIGGLPLFIEAFPSRETVWIVAGGLGAAGWVSVVAARLRGDR